MINIIWGIFIIVGITYGLISGNISVINDEIIEAGNTCLDLILNIMPLLVIWMGLMAIAEKSGLINNIAKLLSPILSKIFPKIPTSHPALGYIASNIAINMAGLGSAATPFGLKAMEELQKLNDDKKCASTSMITFLVLNTSGVTIVPTTILALRKATGSSDPTKVLPLCIMATTASTIGGLTLDYFIRRKNGNK